MIDLKKPLEGGPGLLLMAVLIFFGAILGVIAAKLFAKIEMPGDMANFLGGVMGAALGSAGAVLGSVYIQQREWDARLSPQAIQARDEIVSLGFWVKSGLSSLRKLEPDYQAPFEADWHRSILKETAEELERRKVLPGGANFPSALHSQLRNAEYLIENFSTGLALWSDQHAEPSGDRRSRRNYREMAIEYGESLQSALPELVARLEKFIR